MTHRTLAAIVAVLLLATSTPATDARPRRADADTGTVAAIAVDGTPLRIVATAGAVWVAAGLRGIVRIDPRTNEVVATVDTPIAPDGLAFDGTTLWVATELGPELAGIDPATHEIVAHVVVAEHGLITTVRGRRGGLRLKKTPSEINIGEVVRLTEPHMNLVECFDRATNTCPIDAACGLKGALLAAQKAFLRELDRFTLADFAPKAPALIKLWNKRLGD